MKRNYKFRGKDLRTGRWVYGDLLSPPVTGCRIVNYAENGYRCHDVESNSVGLFSGRFDKNNSEIYEGDIVEDNGGIRSLIVWNVGTYGFNARGDSWCEPIHTLDQPLVIGNIHDNPEYIGFNPRKYTSYN